MAEQNLDLVVQGGVVVNRHWRGRATVLVGQGRIRALLDADAPLPPEARRARVVDAAGHLVLPGGVDPHCHIGLPLGEFSTLDNYAEATTAALWGGTTTVVDFAIPLPGQRPVDAAVQRRKLAEQARCDTALHGCVVDWDDTVPEQLAAMAADGIRTIKMFTTYRDVVMAEPEALLGVMRELGRHQGLTYVHAEANHLIEDAQAMAAARGRVDAGHHDETRPELTEAAAVAAVLATAEHERAPVYFVHQTTPQAVRLVRDARRRGLRAYTETCPHYLALDASVYRAEGPERYVCCPPIRAAETAAGLRAAALRGDIETVGSDHCCYNSTQKASHADDVRAMPNGLPGVETRLPVTWTTLVQGAGLPAERFVALFSTNPARLNGLPGKGVIAPGADADLVVVDPDTPRVATATELHMATDYTPYEGRELTGWPRIVIAAGHVVLDEAGFHDPGPVGRRLAAEPLSEPLTV